MRIPKKYYVLPVVCVRRKLEDNLYINLHWHEGQVGALPVFTNKKTLKKVAKLYGIDVATAFELIGVKNETI